MHDDRGVVGEFGINLGVAGICDVTRTGIDYQKGVAGVLPGEQHPTGVLHLNRFDSRRESKKRETSLS